MSITFGAIQLKSIRVQEPDSITTTHKSKVTGKSESTVKEIPLSADLTVTPETAGDLSFNKLPGLSRADQSKFKADRPVTMSLSVQEDSLQLHTSYQEDEKYMSYRTETYWDQELIGYRHEPEHKFYYTWVPAQDVPEYRDVQRSRQVEDGWKTRPVTRQFTTSLKDKNAFLEFHKLLVDLAPTNQDAKKLLGLIGEKGKSMFSSIATKLEEQLKTKQDSLTAKLKAARADLRAQFKSRKAALEQEIKQQEAELKAAEEQLRQFQGKDTPKSS